MHKRSHDHINHIISCFLSVSECACYILESLFFGFLCAQLLTTTSSSMMSRGRSGISRRINNNENIVSSSSSSSMASEALTDSDDGKQDSNQRRNWASASSVSFAPHIRPGIPYLTQFTSTNVKAVGCCWSGAPCRAHSTFFSHSWFDVPVKFASQPMLKCTKIRISYAQVLHKVVNWPVDSPFAAVV